MAVHADTQNWSKHRQERCLLVGYWAINGVPVWHPPPPRLRSVEKWDRKLVRSRDWENWRETASSRHNRTPAFVESQQLIWAAQGLHKPVNLPARMGSDSWTPAPRWGALVSLWGKKTRFSLRTWSLVGRSSGWSQTHTLFKQYKSDALSYLTKEGHKIGKWCRAWGWSRRSYGRSSREFDQNTLCALWNYQRINKHIFLRKEIMCAKSSTYLVTQCSRLLLLSPTSWHNAHV